MNEVLGYCDKVVDTTDSFNPAFEAPTHCEYCSEPLHYDGIFIRCINDKCSLVQVGNIQNFLEKNNIKGIKRNLLNALYDYNIIRNIIDLFNIDIDHIAKMQGFGEISAENIKSSLNKFKTEGKFLDYELLGSLNIDLFSVSRAKLICEKYDIDEIFEKLNNDRKLFESEICNIKGIKDNIANSMIEGLLKNKELIYSILSNATVTKYKELLKENSMNKSYTICITGALNNFKRPELKKLLESKGHKVVDSVTKNLDYLITNDTSSNTEKNKKAIELNKPIINEQRMMELFEIAI
jgi:DNA ligase (NAD+)